MKEDYRRRLAERLPELRKLAGFPHATDEEILRLSDPPDYTACPNPFLSEVFFSGAGEPSAFSVEPLAADLRTNKHDAIYRAHSLHTKVPHRAIVRDLLHYTCPGELVLDAFAGSGMTGLAAQWCGIAPEADRRAIEAERLQAGLPPPEWGARRAILVELGAAAALVAAGYNLVFDVATVAGEARAILAEIDRELGWMYETRIENEERAIDFTVHSEVFGCPSCGEPIRFFDGALEPETSRVKKEIECSSCKSSCTKKRLRRIFETIPDPLLGSARRIRLDPVRIACGRRTKTPDAEDLAKLEAIARMPAPPELPLDPLPLARMYHGTRLGPKGFTHVHHLFLPRTRQVLCAYLAKVARIRDVRTRNALRLLAQHQFVNASVMNRYRPASSFGNAPLGGVYYVSSLIAEASVPALIEGSVRRLLRMAGEGWARIRETEGMVRISNQSATDLSAMPDGAVAHVFTDPPFGENIPYSDLNFLAEAWHRVRTDSGPEAIIDRFKSKSLDDYREILAASFAECRRVLAPGRWMTVVFSSSKDEVWRALQEALARAGFEVARVQTLDKTMASFRQRTSSAMKRDLVIPARKPLVLKAKKLKTPGGDELWAFVRERLLTLPLADPERSAQALHDRMIAMHLARGLAVSISGREFYAELARRFIERDGRFFLPDPSVNCTEVSGNR